MQEKLVITGMGAVTPIGIGVDTYWNNLVDGKCGIDHITRFDASELPVQIAAQVKDFNPDDFMTKKQSREMDLFMQYGYAAATEALADAGIEEDTVASDRMGVVVGTAMSGVSIIAETQDGLSTGAHKKVSPRFVPKFIGNIAAAQIAIAKGYHGPSLTVSTACSSGADAVTTAAMLLRAGEADAVIVVGADASICPVVLLGLASAHALSTNNDDPLHASRPFDKDRDGFVMGEGAGIVVLESLEHAQKRGAKILAEVVGYGGSNDAFHITSPAEDGSGAAYAMEMALKDAGIAPEKIDYINAHGTSTHHNDLFETMAVKKALGDHAYKVKINSTKSMIGHLLGAAGGVEFIACVKSIEDGFVHATAGLKEAGEGCDLDYTMGEGVPMDIHYALTNSLGFGGVNASLVIKKFED